MSNSHIPTRLPFTTESCNAGSAVEMDNFHLVVGSALQLGVVFLYVVPPTTTHVLLFPPSMAVSVIVYASLKL